MDTRGLFFSVVVMVCAGCVQTGPEQAQRDLEAIATQVADFGAPPERDVAVNAAREALDRSLKDGPSARMKFGALVRGYVREGSLFDEKVRNGWVILVDVNAKNSFGAYTGWQTRYIFLVAGVGKDITELVERRFAGIL